MKLLSEEQEESPPESSADERDTKNPLEANEGSVTANSSPHGKPEAERIHLCAVDV